VKPARARAGWTLLELSVATTILLGVLGIPGILLLTSSGAYRVESVTSELATNSRRALAALGDQLVDAGIDQIDEAAAGPGLSHAQITFRRLEGLAGAAPVWGNQQRVLLQAAANDPIDGVDNDGDGLVDERVLVWIEDLGLPGQSTRVVCRNVSAALEGEVLGNGLDDNGNDLIDEGGLSIAFDGARVTIGLTLERITDQRERLQHTSWRVVALRN